ncbi:hypothetical protein EGW08_000274 [Elysia chlorotica]|uniref:Uncharacterized protein n=1 Tax=Elysia chlorotica TaxID=188477 RepID=A0A433UDY4_ELYCH|nr:hypothetical protein EGW08_000274 [Elysia chlorotica]
MTKVQLTQWFHYRSPACSQKGYSSSPDLQSLGTASQVPSPECPARSEDPEQGKKTEKSFNMHTEDPALREKHREIFQHPHRGPCTQGKTQRNLSTSIRRALHSGKNTEKSFNIHTEGPALREKHREIFQHPHGGPCTQGKTQRNLSTSTQRAMHSGKNTEKSFNIHTEGGPCTQGKTQRNLSTSTQREDPALREKHREIFQHPYGDTLHSGKNTEKSFNIHTEGGPCTGKNTEKSFNIHTEGPALREKHREIFQHPHGGPCTQGKTQRNLSTSTRRTLHSGKNTEKSFNIHTEGGPCTLHSGKNTEKSFNIHTEDTLHSGKNTEKSFNIHTEGHALREKHREIFQHPHRGRTLHSGKNTEKSFNIHTEGHALREKHREIFQHPHGGPCTQGKTQRNLSTSIRRYPALREKHREIFQHPYGDTLHSGKNTEKSFNIHTEGGPCTQGKTQRNLSTCTQRK